MGKRLVTIQGLCWLDDAAWAVIKPSLPKNQPGAWWVDDRRVINRILHVLRSGAQLLSA